MSSENPGKDVPVLLPGLALTVALLPVIAVHVSLVLAIQVGYIPACVPYLEGCASISATGRSMPASFVFKPAMISQWLLLCAYWVACFTWLRLLRGYQMAADRAFLALGGIGALALVVYVTYLGTSEPFYEFMRRFGIYFYFLGTVLAQLLMARQLLRLARTHNDAWLARAARVQMALAVLPFLLGVLNLALKAVLADADKPENAIEWLAAASMQAVFLATAWCWFKTGFRLSGKVQSRRAGGPGASSPTT